MYLGVRESQATHTVRAQVYFVPGTDPVTLILKSIRWNE
jgi:hypothetical protein